MSAVKNLVFAESNARSCQVAASPDAFGAVMFDISGNIRLQLVAPSGQLLGGSLAISQGGFANGDPYLHWDGAPWVALWRARESDDPWMIYLPFLTPSGAPIGEPIQVTKTGGAGSNAFDPRVTSAGGAYTVVWRKDGGGHEDVYMRRVESVDPPQ